MVKWYRIVVEFKEENFKGLNSYTMNEFENKFFTHPICIICLHTVCETKPNGFSCINKCLIDPYHAI